MSRARKFVLSFLVAVVGGHSATVTWRGPAGRWSEPAGWNEGREPGPDDIVRFTEATSRPVLIDGVRSIARLDVELSDPGATLQIDGPGKLILTGADVLVGKPASLRVLRGRLEIGPDLTIEIRGTRFGVLPGGVLVVGSGHVRAAEPDLKLWISQAGSLILKVPRWDNGMDFDLSTNASKGKGDRVLELALPPGDGQGVTFTRFKEHDGDPLVIRGFDPGDFIRFAEDPFRSADPGKGLVLSSVRFEGWPDGGAAEIREEGSYWYLKPLNASIPLVSHSKEPGAVQPSVQLAGKRSRVIVSATEKFRRNMGADMVLLGDGRLFLAFSQWLEGAADEGISRIAGMISSDRGETWSRPFPIVSPRKGCESARMPSLERLSGGALVLVVNCRTTLTESWIGMMRCVDEAVLTNGERAWTHPVRITPAAGQHVVANDRLLRLTSGRLLLPLSTRKDLNIRAWSLYSDDGETWKTSDGMLAGPGRGLVEPSVVELRDRRLLMLMRTQMHRQYRSLSSDSGRTWSPPAEVTRLISPDSPAAIRRDPLTGWLMVVWNHNSNMKGAEDRTPLTVAFSADEGESWFGFLNLDQAAGKTYSYPSITFIDGTAYVTYYEAVNGPAGQHFSLKLCTFRIQP